jgi:hypothetical protein
MKEQNLDWPKSLKLKKADGTIAYSWDGKLHNWDGPALIPLGVARKGEYYLYGNPISKDEWKEMISQKTGLPWYKKPAPKGANHRN